MMFENILILLIELLHIIISIFYAVGVFFIDDKYLPIYLVSLPCIIIDWNDKDKLCWLTQLRNMIKYKSLNPPLKDKNEGKFIYNTTRKLGLNIDYKHFHFILYIILVINWLWGYYRLVNTKKIKIFPNNISKYIVGFLIIGWTIVTIPGYYQ